MKYLQKGWVRVLASLFGGGMIAEIIHISTGDPNRPVANTNSLIVLGAGAILYFILTDLSKKAN
jgi:hypothetical protein